MRMIFGLISVVCALFIVLWLARTQLKAPEILKDTEAEEIGISIQNGATPAEIQKQYRDKVNELMQDREQQLKDE